MLSTASYAEGRAETHPIESVLDDTGVSSVTNWERAASSSRSRTGNNSQRRRRRKKVFPPSLDDVEYGIPFHDALQEVYVSTHNILSPEVGVPKPIFRDCLRVCR